MVTVAITMVLLMGMSAIAVDLGLAFAEKRTDQIGADTAVMAGAIDLVQGQSTQQVFDRIDTFVDTNIRPVDDAAWAGCTDPNPLPVTAADLGVVPATQCVSFDTFEKIRVRVPDQGVDTTFGALLGFDIIDVAAAAEALGIQFTSIGSPPPFALLTGFGGGDLVCLRTSAAGNPPPMMLGNGPGSAPPNLPSRDAMEPDPCDDVAYPADSETFGLLGPWSYFDSDGSIACKLNVNDYFIAAGIDHPVGTYFGKYGVGYSPGDPEVEDGSGCGGNPKSPVNGPDTFAIKTGLTAQELRCGMITLRAGQCATTVSGPAGTTLSSDARLHQGDHVQSTYRFLGERMDNAALWDFFTGGATISFSGAVPSACDDLASALNNSDPDWDYYDKRDALLTCLQDWVSGNYSTQLFTADLWNSSRFSFIPQIAETTLDASAGPGVGPSPCPESGGQCVHINDFVPVWLQTLYTTSPTAACDDQETSGPNTWGLHHAGQLNSCGANNGNLVRLAAIVIDCGMLPQNLCDARPGPPGSTPGGDVAPTFELTK